MGALFDARLTAVSVRRKLAAVRSFFKYLVRMGAVENSPARLVRTPKMPKTLPRVPSEAKANQLLDGVGADNLGKPSVARDLAIFEMLYGCGLRVSESAGLNLEDSDWAERWVRVRGKGRKMRQVPFGGKAAAALERDLAGRTFFAPPRADFLPHAWRPGQG